MAFDLAEIEKQYVDYLKELDLDINNNIHTSAAFAFTSSKHLFLRGKKVAVKVYGKKLDKVSILATELLAELQDLKSNYLDCLMFSLRNQHDIGINNSNQIIEFIRALIEAPKAVKEVKISPIPTGYYNHFLYYFVDTLLSPIKMFPSFNFWRYFHEMEITEAEIAKFLQHTWKEYYEVEARKVSIKIIQNHISNSKNNHSAQKCVDAHLKNIVIERSIHNAKLIFISYMDILQYEKDNNL